MLAGDGCYFVDVFFKLALFLLIMSLYFMRFPLVFKGTIRHDLFAKST